MTFDEAIKHCETVAGRCDGLADNQTENDLFDLAGKSRKCAKEHRQLAEWLKELKRYREHRMDDYE